MKSIALHNLGCKVNAYEIEVMQQKLEEKGYKIVPFAPGADIYIINTCTVTNIADRKSRQMLHKAKKMNPDAIVVACGCYVQTGKETLKQDACIDLAVGNNRKKDIVSILEEYLETKKNVKIEPVVDINHTDEYEEMTLKRTADHTRAYIKIQDGCNQFCSYCVIPYARGRVRSRKPEDVLSEIEGLAKAGYKEVVITGIHISSYGLDFISKEGGDYLNGDIRMEAYKRGYLLKLLKQIQEISDIQRIRLGSLEPRIISEEFAKELSQLTKICPHFHLSLQSGSDSVLKRMNRHYDTEEFLKKTEILRTYFDKPAITTDVITGFPGETNEEFEETRQFTKKAAFYEMHVFKYSKRAGTVAASMKDQIEESVKARRSEVLIEQTKKQSKEYRKQFIGRQEEILLEEEKTIHGKRYFVGHTKNYILVAVPFDREKEENLSGKMISGKIKGFITDEILFI